MMVDDNVNQAKKIEIISEIDGLLGSAAMRRHLDSLEEEILMIDDFLGRLEQDENAVIDKVLDDDPAEGRS